MGNFMKEYGKIDKTRAGKMMTAVGTSMSYTGQQRFVMQTPLDRLYHVSKVSLLVIFLIPIVMILVCIRRN